MAAPFHDLPFPVLDGLLRPRASRDFFEDWWEKSPGHLCAGNDSDREAFRRSDWLGLAKAAMAQGESAVEAIRSGRPSSEVSIESLQQAFVEGASVRIIRVQRIWPFLDAFCRALESELGFRVSANLYVTPEGRQGLDVHADSHDVIVVQMAGGKDWEIFGSPYALPLDYRAPLIFEDKPPRDHRGEPFGARGYQEHEVGPLLMACSLSAGDLLYVPRGFVHKAVAARGTSVHVTIGLHSTTWGDLLALAVAQESRTEPALRETLPPGATRVAAPRLIEAELRSRGRHLFERIHGEALMLETASRFFAARTPSSRPSVGDGDHRTLSVVAEATGSSREQPTPQAAFDPAGLYALAPDAYVSFASGVIDVRSLRTPGSVHSFPEPLRPIFDALVQGRSLTASSMAPLTHRSGGALLSQLATAGILIAAASRDGRRPESVASVNPLPP